MHDWGKAFNWANWLSIAEFLTPEMKVVDTSGLIRDSLPLKFAPFPGKL